MNATQKKKQLMDTITKVLTPLIDNDYVYLDLPYYNNLGDVLIWEGTKCFLQTLPYKCLYASDIYFYIPRKLHKDVIILFQGGGNLGDLYREHSCFRRKIIESYPENKVIILPQSIYYDDSSLMKEDIAFYAKHLNVIICARDKYSYQFLKDRFQNEIKLVPDMAFFIDLKKYKIPQSEDRVLYLRRKDKELSNKNCSEISPVAELHDWPTIECKEKKYEYIDKLFYPIKFLCWLFGMKYRKLAEDYKRDKFYRPSYVQIGINFISKYSIVYTTRLHALILSVLLNKKIFLIDNSTGKLCNFYDTWLSDFDNIIVKNRQNLITPSR